jgi:hypothetical protein
VQRFLRVFLAWLVLALPFAQVAALAHDLSHRNQAVAGAPLDGKKATHSGDCAQCFSYAAFAAGGAVSTPLVFLPETGSTPALGHAIADGRARLNFPYSSRAPPGIPS